MGPAIDSQMTLIGAVLSGLSSFGSNEVGRHQAFCRVWYEVRQSCFEPDKQYGEWMGEKCG